MRTDDFDIEPSTDWPLFFAVAAALVGFLLMGVHWAEAEAERTACLEKAHRDTRKIENCFLRK